MRLKLGLALVAAAISSTQVSQAAELSPVEQQIVAAIKAHDGEAIALLERAARINSGTLNVKGVRDVGALFRQQFDELGFKTSWVDMPPEMGRAGHLVATRTGTQGKRLLLLGHMDTVFEPDSTAPLWQPDGEGVRGQGVADMKAGDVAIIEALRALKQVGALDNTTISVMFTGDEEEAGNPKSVSRGPMVELAKRSDIALSFEGMVGDQSGHPRATVARRATAFFELEVKGKQGHSSAVFGGGGYGAVYEAARILDAFRQQVPEQGLTFNPGVIVGGTEVAFDDAASKGTAAGKTNVIANTVIVKGDLRYLDYGQRDRAQAKMREIVSHSLAGASASVNFRDSYPPMAQTPGNLKVLEAYSQASFDAGLGEVGMVPADARGAGDIQFVAPFVDSLDGLGASGSGAHSPNERLELASMQRAAIRTAILIYRLTR